MLDKLAFVVKCVAAFAFLLTTSQATDPVEINPATATYDFHLSSASTRSGGTWYGWHGYKNGHDNVQARYVTAGGDIQTLHVVCETGFAQGPPRIAAETAQSVTLVWSRKLKDRWQVVMRSLHNGVWGEFVVLSETNRDAIYCTLTTTDDDVLFAAWSSHDGRGWKIRGCQIENGQPSEASNISDGVADAFRPVLASHNGEVWAFWDQYSKPNYSVHGRVVLPTSRQIEMVSPPEEYCLTPTVLSHPSGLHVAWLRKVDVMGGPRVVSQWHTLHAAVRGAGGWRQIETQDGGNVAAELTHGLMAKIAPKPVATGGYLGPRVKPMLIADNDRVWLMWERKSDHRGSTPKVAGELCGRPSHNGKWLDRAVLDQGRVDYHPVHRSEATSTIMQTVASRLPKRGLRTYESFEVDLRKTATFAQDKWRGWAPADLPVASEQTPRRQIVANGKTYKLYWGDFHCHNGLTADAEGQPDEMHNYAADRAALDIVVFTNNDFYNVPLTQYEFELGNLFAKTYSVRTFEDGGRLLSLPGFEWTSRIPGLPTAALADSKNWLPPYKNGSFPNHRSVVYPTTGGPLVHFTEVGNDIARLNSAVQRAGGITLSQHNAFRLSGHPVEVGMELTSGWSNYIASHPKLFHTPLNDGARLGFTANGDTHRRAPGLSGALTGIYAEDLSAEAVLDALRQRRCFATMGSKIFVDSRANNYLMGQELKITNHSVELTVHVIGTRNITGAKLIRNGEVIYEVTNTSGEETEFSFTDSELSKGTHWYYWRISQADAGPVLPGNLMPAFGHLAWSSPHWVTVE